MKARTEHLSLRASLSGFSVSSVSSQSSSKMEGISKLQSPLAAEIQDPKQEENPDHCSQDQELKSCPLNPCEDDVTDRTLKGLDSLQDRPEVQTKNRFPTETQQYSSGKSELSGSTEEKIQDSVDEGEQKLQPFSLRVDHSLASQLYPSDLS